MTLFAFFAADGGVGVIALVRVEECLDLLMAIQALFGVDTATQVVAVNAFRDAVELLVGLCQIAGRDETAHPQCLGVGGGRRKDGERQIEGRLVGVVQPLQKFKEM